MTNKTSLSKTKLDFGKALDFFDYIINGPDHDRSSHFIFLDRRAEQIFKDWKNEFSAAYIKNPKLDCPLIGYAQHDHVVLIIFSDKESLNNLARHLDANNCSAMYRKFSRTEEHLFEPTNRNLIRFPS